MSYIGQPGRRPHFEGCPWYPMMPERHKNGYVFLYAFGTEVGETKIGQTRKPRDRMRTHLKAHQGKITWVHLFAPVPSEGAYLVERYAHRIASMCAQRVGSTELFIGLSKSAAIECVREAILTRTTNYRNEETIKAIYPLIRRAVREVA